MTRNMSEWSLWVADAIDGLGLVALMAIAWGLVEWIGGRL
jgi:hypothetical protein